MSKQKVEATALWWLGAGYGFWTLMIALPRVASKRIKSILGTSVGTEKLMGILMIPYSIVNIYVLTIMFLLDLALQGKIKDLLHRGYLEMSEWPLWSGQDGESRPMVDFSPVVNTISVSVLMVLMLWPFIGVHGFLATALSVVPVYLTQAAIGDLNNVAVAKQYVYVLGTHVDGSHPSASGCAAVTAVLDVLNNVEEHPGETLR
jgi:hypothetical protein